MRRDDLEAAVSDSTAFSKIFFSCLSHSVVMRQLNDFVPELQRRKPNEARLSLQEHLLKRKRVPSRPNFSLTQTAAVFSFSPKTK